MTISDNIITTDIFLHGQKLETVHQCKYLGAIISDEGLRAEILTRSANKTALAKLKYGGIKPLP